MCDNNLIHYKSFKEIVIGCGFFESPDPIMFRYQEELAYCYVFYEYDRIEIGVFSNPPNIKTLYKVIIRDINELATELNKSIELINNYKEII